MGLTFTCVQDINEAEKLWREFSPQDTLVDAWEYRNLFHSYQGQKIEFYAGYDGARCVGVLPLQRNNQYGWLEFFGGDYMEDNQAFIRHGYEHYAADFYACATGPVKLEYMLAQNEYVKNFDLQAYKYIIKLENINNFEDYLVKYLSSESRGKMRRKIKKVEAENIRVTSGKPSDLERLFEFNIQRFVHDSSFKIRPFHKEIFRDTVQLSYPYYIFCFYRQDQLVGVSLSVLYNKTYEYINFGVLEEIPNLRTFVTKVNIEVAIQCGAQIFNAYAEDYGWKEHWHMDRVPQYNLIRGI